jgi:mannitol-1-phosphate 5-dehydrogenase
MQKRVFVGFGFGAIQSGLFLFEAYRSGAFDRLVVAEVMPEVVDALRQTGGVYTLNVATQHGVTVHEVKGVEIFNPSDESDRTQLVAALANASEIATALPSVDFYEHGSPSVADLLALGLTKKIQQQHPLSCITYTAENNNRAAEILHASLKKRIPSHLHYDIDRVHQTLNTVIGKMSKVVADPVEIDTEHLAKITDKLPRAFLVEEFNRILISTVTLSGFQRGIGVFEEKRDLLPFEEAKLYGHNATHALMGYMANRKGYRYLSDVAHDAQLMAMARAAFLEESGRALIARWTGVDGLFSPDGFKAYVDDLMVRMVNPYLRDTVERVIRDPKRKLGWDDRLIGTMRMSLDAGIEPYRFAQGAAAALSLLSASRSSTSPSALLDEIWKGSPDEATGRKGHIKDMVLGISL